MNNPIENLPPLTFTGGLPQDTSNEGAKDGNLLPHREQAPAFSSTPNPAPKPGGSPFTLTGGGK
jgi:hypothetical protein